MRLAGVNQRGISRSAQCNWTAMVHTTSSSRPPSHAAHWEWLFEAKYKESWINMERQLWCSCPFKVCNSRPHTGSPAESRAARWSPMWSITSRARSRGCPGAPQHTASGDTRCPHPRKETHSSALVPGPLAKGRRYHRAKMPPHRGSKMQERGDLSCLCWALDRHHPRRPVGSISLLRCPQRCLPCGARRRKRERPHQRLVRNQKGSKDLSQPPSKPTASPSPTESPRPLVPKPRAGTTPRRCPGGERQEDLSSTGIALRSASRGRLACSPASLSSLAAPSPCEPRKVPTIIPNSGSLPVRRAVPAPLPCPCLHAHTRLSR